eukprot:3188445-Prymnesium_polylepis.2
MAMIQLALVLVYTCVLVIKACDVQETCDTFGFGGAGGLFRFFILFGLSVLGLQFAIGVVGLCSEGRMPKVCEDCSPTPRRFVIFF